MMKMTWRHAICSLAAFAAAIIGYLWADADLLDKMASGLMVLFSILAGLLAQVMVFAGMLVTPDKESRVRLNELRVVLEEQQKYFLCQFKVYLVAVTAMVLMQVLFSQQPPRFGYDWMIRNAISGLCCVIGWAISNAFFIPGRIIALQRLRFDIIEQDIKAAARQSFNARQELSVHSRNSEFTD